MATAEFGSSILPKDHAWGRYIETRPCGAQTVEISTTRVMTTSGCRVISRQWKLRCLMLTSLARYTPTSTLMARCAATSRDLTIRLSRSIGLRPSQAHWGPGWVQDLGFR